MTRILFRESYCSRTREAKLFFIIMVAALVMVIPFGMLTLMLGSAFIIGYPDAGTVKVFLSCVGVLIGSLVVCLVSFLKYREASRIEVREDGLLLGNKRIVKWNEIDDMKLSTETHLDLEVEGGPVMGYGMHGYGIYGYTPSRSVTRHVYRYMSVQIFHKHGVDELYFTPTSFWRFVKAVLQAIKDKHELLADRSWPQKLIRLDRAL
ncbi:MAG: hypothetical protein QXI18_01060 [Nitrososphaerota archaeon]